MAKTLDFERRQYVSRQPNLQRVKYILDTLQILAADTALPPRLVPQFFQQVSYEQPSLWRPVLFTVYLNDTAPSDIPQIFQGLDTDIWDGELFPQAGIGAAITLILQQQAFVEDLTPFNILIQRNSVFWGPEPEQQFSGNVGAIIANLGLDAVVPPPPPPPESGVYLYKRYRFNNPVVVMQ